MITEILYICNKVYFVRSDLSLFLGRCQGVRAAGRWSMGRTPLHRRSRNW